jgi:hypothetical protein
MASRRSILDSFSPDDYALTADGLLLMCPITSLRHWAIGGVLVHYQNL